MGNISLLSLSQCPTLSHLIQIVQFDNRLGLSLTTVLYWTWQKVPSVYFLDLKSVIRRTVLLFLDENGEGPSPAPARQFVYLRLIDKTLKLGKMFSEQTPTVLSDNSEEYKLQLLLYFSLSKSVNIIWKS